MQSRSGRPYFLSMAEHERPGFWKRQFTGEPTYWQNFFDAIFGIVMPLICLVLDPVVFRGSDRVLAHYRELAYTFIGGEIAVLTVWLALRERLGSGALFVAGPLLAGGLFALALHAWMLPMTLLGLVFGIGILGFTPFLTAVTFLRNGVRAVATCRYRLNWGSRTGILLAGMLVMGLPSLGVLHFRHRESFAEFVEAAVTGRVSRCEGGTDSRD